MCKSKSEEAPGLPLRVNGLLRDFEPGQTMADLLRVLQAEGPGVAVERNRQVVRRADYARVLLEPGDEIEIVRLVGGG